jgi:NADH dehydrogenase [ubiquinone] 1 alpha subcomplex assembly factor 5
MNQVRLIFDRKRQSFLKSRAISLHQDKKSYFLHEEIESILLERLAYSRYKFPKVLLTAPVSQHFIKNLLSQGHGKSCFVELYPGIISPFQQKKGTCPVIGDEENLPFLEKSFNLVISFLGLHQLNDVMGTLTRSHSLLDREGLYLSAFFGGETLLELRESLLSAEIEMTNGASPRVHPMITPEDAMMLFNNAGFKWPVIDHEKINIIYPSLSSLLKEIKSIGESISLIERTRKPLSRLILKRAETIYQGTFGTAEGKLKATVDVIFLTGWT